MSIVTRLTNSGTYILNGEFDEVTKTEISVTTNTVYAKELDEITLTSSNSVKHRQLSTGIIQVADKFDEFTGAIVADPSLVLWLDAGQETSYSGSGTAWTDLSGNGRNGTLTNSPTFSRANGGQIVFDGTDDYAITSSSIGVVSAATFLIWLKRNGSQVFFPGLIYERTGSINGLSLRESTHQIGYTWDVSQFNWVSGLTVPDDQWCMVVVSVSPTSGTAYLCQASGITSATNSVSHPSTTFGIFNVGRDPLGSEQRYFKGSISSTMIYNRALSAAEVTQNFNALRRRFGI